MENATPKEKSKSAVIRAEFDKILMHHVSSLIDTREDIAALPFNLATIASLLLLADRENEIKSFPESPPERYNRETFLSDIEEIGLDLDEDAISAIQHLEQYGFLVINPQGQYASRESATLLIMVLDAIFPQMPGMNLVAYVSQAIEEVLTSRKEQDRALQSFDQTLEKQGVRLSAVPKDRLASSAAEQILTHEAPDPEVLLARRAAYLQKLKALRSKRLSTDATPSVLAGGAQLKHVKIRELFPRKDETAEPESQPEEMLPDDTVGIPEPAAAVDEPMEDAAPPDMEAEDVLAETEDVLAEAEDVLTETEENRIESTPESLQETLEEAVPPPPEMQADETLSEIAEPDDSVAEAADIPEPEDVEVEETLSREELIERQIRQFEEELAMPCPICGIGKVLSDTTEKGKTYYHCSNEECRLISWGKPYHMECPICKNPFLIEVPEPDGEIGLKCPRATCTYRKKGGASALPEEKGTSGKRKVAVVKRKRKKGVRRVVRRKK